MRKALSEHKDFFMSNIREEWNQMEKIVSKQRVVQNEDVAIVMTKIIFGLLNAGGILTVLGAGENVLHAVGRIFGQQCAFEKKSFQKAIRYLGRKKYLQVARRTGGWTLHLTERGTDRMLAVLYNNLRLKKSEPWDGVWRVVFFDIPNMRKWARDGFRNKLKKMNFLKLQKSVFVTPNPCREEIKFLSSFFGIPHCVRMIETRFLGGDAEIKRNVGV